MVFIERDMNWVIILIIERKKKNLYNDEEYEVVLSFLNKSFDRERFFEIGEVCEVYFFFVVFVDGNVYDWYL